MPVVAALLALFALPSADAAGEPYGQPAADAASRTLTALLTSTLADRPKLDVVAAHELSNLVALEGEREVMGCADSGCLADVAGALGARYVVFGDLGKLGGDLHLSLSLFDSQDARSIGRVVLSDGDLDGVVRQIPWGVAKLIEPARFAAPALEDPAQGDPAAATATGDPAPRDAEPATLDAELTSRDAEPGPRDAEPASRDPAAVRVVVMPVAVPATLFPPPAAAPPPAPMLSPRLGPLLTGVGQVACGLAPVIFLASTPCAPCLVCYPPFGALLQVVVGDFIGARRSALLWPLLASAALAVPLVLLPVAFSTMVGAVLFGVSYAIRDARERGEQLPFMLDQASGNLLDYGSSVALGLLQGGAGVTLAGNAAVLAAVPLVYWYFSDEKADHDVGLSLPGLFSPDHPAPPEALDGNAPQARSRAAPRPALAMRY